MQAVWKATGVCAVISLFFAAYPEALVAMFQSDDPEVMRLLQQVSVWIALGQIADGASYAQMLQLRAFGDAWLATMLRITCVLIGVGVAEAFIHTTDKDIQSLAIGYCIAECLSYISLSLRLRYFIHLYRKEFNVQPAPSTCLSYGHAAWGFLGRERQRRVLSDSVAPIEMEQSDIELANNVDMNTIQII